MKRIAVVSVISFSLGLNLSLGILYLTRKSPAAGKSPGQGGGCPGCFLERLNLDGRQKGKLASLRQSIGRKRAVHWKSVCSLRATLAHIIGAEEPDMARVERLVRAFSMKRGGFQVSVVRHLLEVKRLLNPMQKRVFRRLLKKHIFRGIRGPGSARCRVKG